jgi:hypothetical protein
VIQNGSIESRVIQNDDVSSNGLFDSQDQHCLAADSLDQVNTYLNLSVVDGSVGRALSFSHEGPGSNLCTDICSFRY